MLRAYLEARRQVPGIECAVRGGHDAATRGGVVHVAVVVLCVEDVYTSCPQLKSMPGGAQIIAQKWQDRPLLDEKKKTA